MGSTLDFRSLEWSSGRAAAAGRDSAAKLRYERNERVSVRQITSVMRGGKERHPRPRPPRAHALVSFRKSDVKWEGWGRESKSGQSLSIPFGLTTVQRSRSFHFGKWGSSLARSLAPVCLSDSRSGLSTDRDRARQASSRLFVPFFRSRRKSFGLINFTAIGGNGDMENVAKQDLVLKFPCSALHYTAGRARLRLKP